MRIVQVSHSSLGGSAIVCAELAISLGEQGHDVHLVGISPPPRLTAHPNVTFHPVAVPDYPVFSVPPTTLAFASKLADLCSETDEPTHILHAHYAVPHATALHLATDILKTRTKTVPKTVVTLHGTDVIGIGSEAPYHATVRASLARMDRVTAVSEDLRRRALSVFQLKHIDTIANFVPQSSNREDRRSALPEPRNILHVSNMRPVKCSHRIVPVFEKVHIRRPETTLTIIGSGPQFKRVQDQVAQSRARSHITLLPCTPSLEQHLQAASLVWVTSQYESFGLFALESLAWGIPVIAPRVGGLMSVVQDRQTGRTIDANSEAALLEGFADATLTLMNNPQELHRMGAEAYEQSRTRFGRTEITDQYLHLYRGIL